MSRRRFAVKEMFYTLQGEGTNAGRPAVFCRFAGCNIWTGREEDRERDAVKGTCARWCDTDFVGTNGAGGGVYLLEDLVTALNATWPQGTRSWDYKLVVFTGGEPTLQLTAALVDLLHLNGWAVAVETNGSNPVPPAVDHICLSPKPPMPVNEETIYDEVKCVYPAGFDPEAYLGFGDVHYIQPRDDADPAKRAEYLKVAVDYVLAHPQWRLSLQTHKLVGLP